MFSRQRKPSAPTAAAGTQTAAALTRATLSRSDTRHEREADRVADQTMRWPPSTDASEVHDAPPRPTVLLSGTSGGRPLDASVREVMARRFGHDFRHVRVHTDRQAAELAQGINARAFTLGQRVFFDSGQYAPETTRGGRLLAHELAHVVQHDRGLVDSSRVQRQPNDSFARTRRPVAMTGSVVPWPGISISWTHSNNDAGTPVLSVTIAAKLQLFGPNASDEIAQAMKDEIESFWTTSFPDGSQVHTTVDVSRRDDDAPPDPDAVQVRVISAPIRSYVTPIAGGVEMTYTVENRPGTVAHEFGHLLGLDDRYRDTWWALVSEWSYGVVGGGSQSETEPGYEGNVMGGEAGGVLEIKNIHDLLLEHGSGR